MHTLLSKWFLILVLISFNTACTANETVRVNSLDISLSSKSCSLSINSKITYLDINNTCYFVKKSDSGDIRVEYYDDIKSYVVVIVGNLVRNNPDFPLTSIRKDCGSELQAIIISRAGSLKISAISSGAITCAGIGIDEKEYWLLAHQ